MSRWADCCSPQIITKYLLWVYLINWATYRSDLTLSSFPSKLCDLLSGLMSSYNRRFGLPDFQLYAQLQDSRAAQLNTLSHIHIIIYSEQWPKAKTPSSNYLHWRATRTSRKRLQNDSIPRRAVERRTRFEGRPERREGRGESEKSFAPFN